MLPGAVTYAYIGWLPGDVAAVSVDAVDAGLARHAMSVWGWRRRFAVVVVIARLARRSLAEEIHVRRCRSRRADVEAFLRWQP